MWRNTSCSGLGAATTATFWLSSLRAWEALLRISPKSAWSGGGVRARRMRCLSSSSSSRTLRMEST